MDKVKVLTALRDALIRLEADHKQLTGQIDALKKAIANVEAEVNDA